MTIPLPVLLNVYRVAVRWANTTSSITAVNVMHFQALAAGSTPAALAALMWSHGTNAMFQPMATTTHATQFDIIPLDGVSPTTSYTDPGGTNWSGLGTSAPVPQVCALIKLQTAVRGRQNRGRIYIPHLAEGALNAGTIGASTGTTMGTAWTTFNTALQAGTPHAYEMVVASYDRTHSGAGAHENPVTNFIGENFTATQRRRQPGRKVSRH